MIQRYVSKISGPLRDRIDIHIDVLAVNYKEMRSTHEPESSATIRERVIRARQKQLLRFSTSCEKLYCNAEMSSRHIRTHGDLSADCERLLGRAMTQQGLSARAHDRILKVTRTVADLEDSANLEPKHIAEAIQPAAWTAPIGHKLKVAAARASSCARRTAEGGCPHIFAVAVPTFRRMHGEHQLPVN
jgi:magnesium chelatase family protein